jgi:tRNA(fMet)-specific endonuclease VapC
MSGTKIILDTNALLLYLQGNFKIEFDISEIGISVITKIEYLVNPELGAKDLYLFDELESQIKIFFLDKDNDSILKETIKIRKKYKLKLPDAIIAATAIVNNATLLSADDIFAKIYNLKFELIKR